MSSLRGSDAMLRLAVAESRRQSEVLAECERLDKFAKGLGLDRRVAIQIIEQVHAEARVSATWGTIEDRTAEIRRRMLTAAK